MITTVLQVDGMACEHCVKAVTRAVRALDGVNAVQVSLPEHTVSIEYNPTGSTIQQLKDAIEEQGYDVVS